MNKHNMSLFNDFKEYLNNNSYEVEEINETSIRGIKGDLKLHLFKETLFDEYVFNINNNGYKIYNTLFVEDKKGYKLNHKNDNRRFNNIYDIINYTKDNINIEI
ncbi:hypothetical protein NSA23_00725 [Anaerosalibacter massiliensis]|uniref:Uncharacterized protein n=1 Tax=Anaerosalibacter massiliensis TaxID=1347392 RepID=A0A9X2S3P1_9FIRM|nr:hypothetical protein [Anaerosalibacter massiliensis]MCR2042628.1 hypothetical protein [Anaerosalibacter massiliensis]